MEESAAGHLMLPCTRYPARMTETQLAFAAEAAAASAPHSPHETQQHSDQEQGLDLAFADIRALLTKQRAAASSTSAPAPPATE